MVTKIVSYRKKTSLLEEFGEVAWEGSPYGHIARWQNQRTVKEKHFLCVFVELLNHFLVFFPLQLFIKSNQGGEETTKINYLTFIGTPVQATNMNDFKRVRSSCSSLCLFV